MRIAFARFRWTTLFGLAAVRIAIFGMIGFGTIAFGSSRALAQKEETDPGKIRQSSYAALREAPQKAQVRKNPFEGDPRAVAVGEKLFEQHCSECHGRKAGGTRKGPTLLRDEVQQAPPGALFWVLTNGVVRRGMPVWSKLPEQQRWQLVTFLQSLRTRAETPRP